MSDEYAWFDKGDGRQVYRRVNRGVEAPRSGLPCPMIVTDQIELQSQVDGKVYTSKRALQQSYRAQGYVEVGNEWLNKDFSKPAPSVDRKAVRNAVGKAMNRAGISV